MPTLQAARHCVLRLPPAQGIMAYDFRPPPDAPKLPAPWRDALPRLGLLAILLCLALLATGRFGVLGLSIAMLALLLRANARLAHGLRAAADPLTGAMHPRPMAACPAAPAARPDPVASHHDPLTGLANRRACADWLASLASAAPAPLGLIVLDIDHLQDFNDFNGRVAGDACLQSVARCLREQLRGTSDLLARLGGAEFAVLLPGLSDSACADIAERLRHAVQMLELPHVGIGKAGLVSISAGVASLRHGVPEATPKLFDSARAALAVAKMTGRNNVRIAAAALDA